MFAEPQQQLDLAQAGFSNLHWLDGLRDQVLVCLRDFVDGREDLRRRLPPQPGWFCGAGLCGGVGDPSGMKPTDQFPRQASALQIQLQRQQFIV